MRGSVISICVGALLLCGSAAKSQVANDPFQSVPAPSARPRPAPEPRPPRTATPNGAEAAIAPLARQLQQELQSASRQPIRRRLVSGDIDSIDEISSTYLVTIHGITQHASMRQRIVSRQFSNMPPTQEESSGSLVLSWSNMGHFGCREIEGMAGFFEIQINLEQRGWNSSVRIGGSTSITPGNSRRLISGNDYNFIKEIVLGSFDRASMLRVQGVLLRIQSQFVPPDRRQDYERDLPFSHGLCAG